MFYKRPPSDSRCSPRGSTISQVTHLHVLVVGRHRNKLGQPLAEPHGDVAVHVDGEWFVALLQAADGEVLQSADVFTEVHAPQLTHAQTGHGDETWRAEIKYSEGNF